MSFYIALDAGGTHTRALLADDSHVLARATTGTVKLMRVSEAEATTRLQTLLRDLAREASVPLSAITRTCFGLAGSSSQSVRDWALRALTPILATPIDLTGDIDILLDAAFPASPSNPAEGVGIVIIAGTGSNCIGRTADGTLHTAGGWGPVLGDEGSGFWIGLESIRAALRSLDHTPHSALTGSAAPVDSPGAPFVAASSQRVGSTTSAPENPATHLLNAIQTHLHLASLGELIAVGNLRAPSSHTVPPDFAALTRTVADCAAAGNPIALDVLTRAGHHLAHFVNLVARKMFLATGNRQPATQVAFTGSVLAHIAPVREAFAAELARSLPNSTLRLTPVDPLDGALYRARHQSRP